MSMYLYAPHKTVTAEIEAAPIAAHAARLCGCAFLSRQRPRKFFGASRDLIFKEASIDTQLFSA